MARETAPVFYSIAGPSFGLAIGEVFSLGALRRVREVTASDGKIEVYIDGLLLKRFDTSGEAASVTASISQAVVAIDRSIQQQATTAAPAPAPTPTPRVTSNVVTKTTITNTTNTTATATANATTTSNSITRTTVTNTTSSTSGSRTVVVAPQPDVQTVTTVADLPIKIVTDPITVTLPQFDSSGRVTGNTQVTLDAPPLTVDDPLQLVITDEPLATVNLDDIQVPIQPLADFSSDDAAILEAQGEATAQDQANFAAKEDWRVRLSLAPDSQYLYNAKPDPGILKPLLETDGVIFPYTPSISVNYAASYEQTNLVHSNYKIFQYSGSGVDSVSLACAFTAQDTYEANYLLAVIHFFRSMTKMFYGQDDNPKNGTPPPLCYMFGMGGYQFAAHPLAIQGFSYTLPDDVDYIKTTSAAPAGTPRPSAYTPSDARLAGSGVGKGGKGPGPNFSTSPGNDTVTWVPTRIQMTITCVPIMSRNAVSNRFSLRDYASGALLNGTRVPGGGMW
jgi:hypothetical protein